MGRVIDRLLHAQENAEQLEGNKSIQIPNTCVDPSESVQSQIPCSSSSMI